jgi:3-oxoacyl-[acyl-carrier protein] reductase
MKKVALVTGASRGLGANLAVEFARAGYRVVINYRSRGALAARVARKISHDDGEAFCWRADVGSGPDVEMMVEKVIARWGRLDVLVNNAGITHEELLISMNDHDWDRVMDTNLKGAFNCSRAAGRHMLRQRSGHIINICSILGVCGARGESGYAASKAALIGLTTSLARELGGSGVSVNAVMPGFMRTSMTRTVAGETRDAAQAGNVLKRFSDPAAVACFIVHLAGMATVSGQLFNLDGRIYRWA